IAGQITRPAPGTVVHIPPGVPHGFKNVGSTRARLVDYHFPGGFERFFEEVGVAAIDDTPPHCQRRIWKRCAPSSINMGWICRDKLPCAISRNSHAEVLRSIS